MTHLKIELPEGYVEYVADSVVEKLYESVTNSTLDNESNLLGTVHVNSALRSHVEHLLTRFPNFHINSTNYVLEFLDPRAYDFFTNVINNGVPMTELRFASLTSSEIGRDFFEPVTDATFRYLPELKLCKSITYLHAFNGINVYMVDLSNIESIKSGAFGRAILSKKIWLTATKITNIGIAMHQYGGTEDGSIVLPENLQVYYGLYVAYSNINKVYFRMQTPPEMKGDLTDIVTYYVPVGTSQAYQDAIDNKNDGSAWNSNYYSIVEYDYETDELDLLSPFVYPETVTY